MQTKPLGSETLPPGADDPREHERHSEQVTEKRDLEWMLLRRDMTDDDDHDCEAGAGANHVKGTTKGS
jgi:hypothetical protein